MTLALKIFLAPLMITLATIIGRRWGPALSGWLIGFPFTSGPVSFILASQYDANFAAQAAIGTLAGQLCVLTFCLVYSFAALKFACPISLLLSLIAYFCVVVLGYGMKLSIFPTFLIVLVVTLLVIRLIPSQSLTSHLHQPPAWDIPARVLIAALFVFTLTTFADWLGPHLSGLIAPFPIYGIVLTVFAHLQQGSVAARQTLRGVALGSFAFSSFFLVTGLLLPLAGIGWTYLAAVMITIMVNIAVLILSRRKERVVSQ